MSVSNYITWERLDRISSYFSHFMFVIVHIRILIFIFGHSTFYPRGFLYRYYNNIPYRVAIFLFYLYRNKYLSYNFYGENRTTSPRTTTSVTHDLYVTRVPLTASGWHSKTYVCKAKTNLTLGTNRCRWLTK